MNEAIGNLGKWQVKVLTVARSSGSYYLNDLLPGDYKENWSAYCSLHRAALSLDGLELVRFERGVVFPKNENTRWEDAPGVSSESSTGVKTS